MILEEEPDLSYIGCELKVGVSSVELLFKVPGYNELATEPGLGDSNLRGHFCDQLWRYRVGTADMRALRSGLESRLYGAARLSFPTHRAQAAVIKVPTFSIHLKY